MTIDTRIKFQDIVENQLPRFVREDFPLLSDFLKSFYVSQEIPGGPYDLIQNLDRYVKVDELFALKDSTILNGDLNMSAVSIKAGAEGNFTVGFPENNGLIKIDDEIITYDYKTDSTFEGCKRGFSGITSYIGTNTPDKLVFSPSVAGIHTSGSPIQNLNIVFLQEFFKKVKTQFAPGFTDRAFAPEIDQRNFIFNSESFYTSKGTDNAFEILFKALYSANVEVIHPDRYLFRPSNADYKITKDFIVETISGDPKELTNLTITQKATGARGTVTRVVPILYDKGQYHEISIDSGFSRDISVKGTIFNEFDVNPKTKITNEISIGTTTLDVDSTLGFPDTGKLIMLDVDNQPVSLAYTGKTVNQFFDITGINNTFPAGTDARIDDYSYAYVGVNTTEQIQVRIGAALQDIDFKEPNFSYEPGDVIRLQSLGVQSQLEKAVNFIGNIKTKWELKNITLLDEDQRTYQFTTWDTQYLRAGHTFIMKSRDPIPVVVTGSVTQITSPYTFEVILSNNISLVKIWDLENQILKGDSSKYPYINNYITNVLNTYVRTRTGDVLVATNSIPSYENKEINPYDRKISYTGRLVSQEEIPLTTTTDHGFYTGDTLYYKAGVTLVVSTTSDGLTFETPIDSRFNNIDDGVYYVRRVDANRIKMSRSKGNLYNDIYVEFTGDVEDNLFIYYEFKDKIFDAQKTVRALLPPDKKSGSYVTPPGYTGILNNGVEIMNYKSQNSTVYYGDVRSFEVKRGGYNYDVVNPPVLVINDDVGVGATGTVATQGEFERIEILNTGYDYVDTPVVLISGGNAEEDAEAEVRTIAVPHELPFNAGEESKGSRGVDLTNNTIGFTTFHKFRDAEEIIYESRDLDRVVGLVTQSSYYVSVVDNYIIKLHNKEQDAIEGINVVDLTDYGQGRQFIKTAQLKRIVSSVEITKKGKGYQNKKRTIRTTGISTAANTFAIPSHGYLNKEIVQYTAPETGDSVTGLSSNDDYYVVKKSEDEFGLRLVGVGSTAKDYYWNNVIPVDITKGGGGSFNYQPIVARVEGSIGVSTRAGGQDFQAVLQPVVRGLVTSVDLTQNGVGYGASEIVNFNRQPVITFENGELAQAKPVINNGQITSIMIQNSGRNYHAPPDVTIKSADGDFAQLTPIIDTGKLVEIKVIKGGAGYVKDETDIIIKSPGATAQVEATIRTWQVNLFQRNFNNIESDDGVLDENLSHDKLQYSHIYVPRALRESTYAISGEAIDNTLYGTPDLVKLDGSEVASSEHSPILGWAYDGHPIYGPYALTNTDGSGSIGEMTSGYELKVGDVLVTDAVDATNRPPVSVYPAGFFVEDFVYTGNGDLDEHNGRFAITPDYPKGTYAYHATINAQNDSTGPFENYRSPAFPYFIGKSFKSKPNPFNFSIESNQDEYDIETGEWLRNTRDYHTNSVRSGYDYIFNSNDVKEQTLEITETSLGHINNIGITSGGTKYKMGDEVEFDNAGTNGRNANAEVARVAGKVIDTVSLATTSFDNVEFVPSRTSTTFVGVTTAPHNLLNRDIVRISGLSTNVGGLSASYSVGVTSEALSLTVGMAATTNSGQVEWVNVGGALGNSSLRDNDILIVDQEKVKVLDINVDAGQILVRRAQSGTTAGIHSSRAILFEDPRTFSFQVAGISTTKKFRLNRQQYFYPADVVGMGTARGTARSTGYGTTISFSRTIGLGLTQVWVPSQSLWFADHGYQLNDEVVYSANGGTPIKAYSGVTATPYRNLDTYDNLYAVPLDSNTIGLSTGRVGLGSDSNGYYVGVNSSLVPSTLYFPTQTLTGVGNTHSLLTRLTDTISGKVTQNVVTVSTATTHILEKDDTVFVSVKPIGVTTVTVKYNDYNRRIVFDPQDFVAGDVDLSLNTISVTEGVFNLGDKVIHTASTPSGGLVDEKMYYVIFYDKTNIRLVEDRIQVQSTNPKFVDITSASAGTLSKVNPSLLARKNQQIKFDLSDSSLSFIDNGETYSAFDLNLYINSEYTDEFVTTEKNDAYEVLKTGRIGIDATANLLLTLTDDIPKNLFYKFSQDNISIIPDVKKQIVIDTLVSNFNQINIRATFYDGNWSVSGVGATTFQYNIPNTPDVTSYTKANSKPVYETTSKTAEGAILKFKVKSGGAMYKIAPRVSGVGAGTTVRSGIGSGAILTAETSSIGQITKTRLNSIGFDYPSDKTLKVIPNLPDIVEVERLNTLGSIGITSQGRNYLVSPDLVIQDGYTKQVLNDVDLEYALGDTEVRIVKNTEGIYDVPPIILPVGNSNGVVIRDLLYSNTGGGTSTGKPNTVRLYIDDVFQEAEDFNKGGWFPGEKFMLENVSVGLGSTGTGYNSKEYNYHLWEVTAASGQIGGANAFIEFTFPDGFIGVGRTPGKMVPGRSFARAILKEHFPVYEPVVLKQSEFFTGETVEDEVGAQGIIQRWVPESNTLTISAQQEFDVGSKIKGLSSRVQAYIKKNVSFAAEIATGAGATVNHGFQSDSGFLNNSFQRLPDNGYYQRFAYALRSQVPIDKWGDDVKALSHVAGFDRWSDLEIESKDPDAVITRTEPANFELVAEQQCYGDVQSYPDFDDVSEITVDVAGQIISKEVLFANRPITDYYQSIGNRALDIDDFSATFNDRERPTKFSTVGEFTDNDVFNKIFTLVKDQTYSDERQFSIVSLLQHDNVAYINEYATVETYPELGTFDYAPKKEGWDLTFVPNKNEYNLYDISSVSISVKDNIVGVASTALGDSCYLDDSQTNIGANVRKNIVEFGVDYRAAHIMVQLENNVQEFVGSEFNLIHDGTKVALNQYGDLTNSLSPDSLDVGFGTYYATIEGGHVKLDFHEAVGAAVTANASFIALEKYGSVGVGSVTLDIGRLTSNKQTVGVGSTATPIASYGTDGSGFDFKATTGYYFVSVEGANAASTGQYECFEVAVLNSSSNVVTVDYANVGLNTTSLGTVDAQLVGDSVDITYSPRAGASVHVKTFGIEMQIYDNIPLAPSLDLDNTEWYSKFGRYVGTKLDLQTAFNLKHDEKQIFRRIFDGSSDAGTGGNGINLTNNTVDIPDHYFVTGEKVNYSYTGSSTVNAVGIKAATVAGVSTTKLPNELYVVKFSNSGLRFAESAAKALQQVPETFELNSVGIGTSHHITATNQNSKSLVTIDNMIQSPIAGTAVTTALSAAIVFGQNTPVVGITSFAAADLVKIDDEICKVLDVGVNGNNLTLLRGQLGTPVEAHSNGSVITKLSGNYNIALNTLHFAQAPKGNTPLSTTSDPDETSWVGLVTHSTFHGRIFTRTAPPRSTKETYTTNAVFNDISDQFTGIQSAFSLTTGYGSSETNALGFSTYNGVLLINDMFQEPASTEQGNYSFGEGSGITTVTFTGEETSLAAYRRPTDTVLGENANRTNYPNGGKILSVGSTGGLGYQPLVAAGGTAIVSGVGTITSISIGNTGSGYRSGIQTTVNVGVQTYGVGIASYVSIGTAAISGGHIVSIAVTNPGIGYTYYPIDSTTFMTAAGAAGTTIIGVADTSRITTGSIISIAQTTNSSTTSKVTLIANVSVVSVGQSQFTIGTGDTISSAIGIGTTTAAPVVTIKSFDPPEVVIDSPLNYTNIPLIYDPNSTTGAGQSASVDFVVGMGGSVVDFKVKREGFGYGNGEILTVATGGATGIPTTSSTSHIDFELTVQKIHTDEFSGWHFGQLEALDNFSTDLDGFRTVFQMKVSNKPVSLKTAPGWNVSPVHSLLVFVNGLLQEPGYAYNLGSGGSSIVFSTAPNADDYIHVLFYKGTPGIDVALLNVAKTIKKGDQIDIQNNPEKLFNGYPQGPGLNQEPRIIVGITSLSSDSVTTTPYNGIGISTDISLLRPSNWRKQTSDLIVNNRPVGKDRVELEADIFPTAFAIQPIGAGTTYVYVDTVRPFFNQYNEQSASRDTLQDFINIAEQDDKLPGIATAIVSDTGTVSSIDLTNIGVGYTAVPTLTFSPPPEGGSFVTATATCTVGAAGTITSVTVTNAGTGYTTTNPPVLEIAAPQAVKEVKVDVDAYEGDFGTIVGFGTTTTSGKPQIIFDFYIPDGSPLRDVASGGTGPVSAATTVSGITTGDFFTANNTNYTFGDGTLETRKTDSTIKVGATTSFLDCVYQVASAETVTVTNASIGATGINGPFTGLTTDVRRVFCNIAGIGTENFSSTYFKFDQNKTGVGTVTFDTQNITTYSGTITVSPNLGHFSWGKITVQRKEGNTFTYYGDNGISGLSTSTVITRYNPLKMKEYVIS